MLLFNRSIRFGRTVRPIATFAVAAIAVGMLHTPAFGFQQSTTVDVKAGTPSQTDTARNSRRATGNGSDASPQVVQSATPTLIEGAEAMREARMPVSQDVLAGPTVIDLGSDREGRMPASMQRGQQSRVVPMPVWNRVMNTLDLSREQKSQLDEMQQRFLEQQRAFQAEHGPAMRELRQQFAALQAAEQTANAETRNRRNAADSASTQAVRRQINALRSRAPQPERLQQSMWNVLNQSQQEKMRERLSVIQQQRRVTASEMHIQLGENMEPSNMEGAEIRRMDANDSDAGIAPQFADSDQPIVRRKGAQVAEMRFDDAAQKRLRFLRERQQQAAQQRRQQQQRQGRMSGQNQE